MADFFETSVDYLIGHSDIDHVIETVQQYDLNSDESQLIDNYRELSKKQKTAVSMIADSLRACSH